MHYNLIHPFPISNEQKAKLQIALQNQIHFSPYPQTPKTIAGIDLAYTDEQAIAVVVVMEQHSKQILEVVHHIDNVTEPYIPGMLAFRELPLILQAWEKVTIEPDVVFFDGNGIMHPRRMGIATHTSLFLEKPTIGVAKTYLLGEYETLGEQQGSWERVYDQGEEIGAVLRTQTGVKPVFVSVGNYMTLADVLRLCMGQVGKKSRIPEVVRQADIWTRKLRRELKIK